MKRASVSAWPSTATIETHAEDSCSGPGAARTVPFIDDETTEILHAG